MGTIGPRLFRLVMDEVKAGHHDPDRMADLTEDLIDNLAIVVVAATGADRDCMRKVTKLVLPALVEAAASAAEKYDISMAEVSETH